MISDQELILSIDIVYILAPSLQGAVVKASADGEQGEK